MCIWDWMGFPPMEPEGLAGKLPTIVCNNLGWEIICNGDFPGDSDRKASVYNVGDLGLIPGRGKPPGEGNGNPLQYSCLENPMDGGAW